MSDPTRERPAQGLPFHEFVIVGPSEELRIPVKHRETGDLIVACVNAVRVAAKRHGATPEVFARLLEGAEPGLRINLTGDAKDETILSVPIRFRDDTDEEAK